MEGARVTVAGQLLSGRALPLARPRLWAPQPVADGQGPRISRKGSYSFQGASFLSLERYPGLLQVFCLRWVGAGAAALELRAQQDVLNTGEPWAIVRLQRRCGLICAS